LLSGHETKAFKHRKALFSNRLLFQTLNTHGHETWLMIEKILSSASGRNGIFAKSPCCDTSWQSVQLWNLWSPECWNTFPNR